MGSFFTLYTVISVSQVCLYIICCLAWRSSGPSYHHLLPETPSDSHFTPHDQRVNYTQAVRGFTLAAALSALGLTVVMSNICHLDSGKIKQRRWGRQATLTHYLWAARELPSTRGGDPHHDPPARAALVGLWKACSKDEINKQPEKTLHQGPGEPCPAVASCWAEWALKAGPAV